VEVTKLSLLLKVLEEESGESLNKSWAIFHERALPDLDSNIKCGNSLIGPDYFEGRLALDDDEPRRINPFDWGAGFPDIIKRKGAKESSGFDVVLGNPPYVRMEEFKEIKDYLKREFTCHDERSDLYAYFIERSHHLLNVRGRFGMIVSNKFLRANYGKPLRDFLRENACVEQVVDFAGLPVFQGATVRTIVLITSRARVDSANLLYVPPLSDEQFVAVEGGSVSVDKAVSGNGYTLPQTALDTHGWGFAEPGNDALIKKLQEHGLRLVEYSKGQIMRGVVSGLTEAFVIDNDTRKALIKDTPAAAKVLKPFLNGRDVRRYYIDSKNLWLIYTHHGFPIRNFPAIERHLRPFKEKLEARATKQEWYELQQPQFRFVPFLDGPKIIFPDIATEPRFALDESGYFGANTIYFIPGRDLYLLALLNSSVGGFFFRAVCAGLESKGETYLRFFGQYLEGFPVAVAENKPSGKERRDNVVGLVEQMLALKKQFAGAKTPHDKTAIERRIETTDIAINQTVYELYGLSGEEIEIIEKSASAKSDN
jgi:Eco57I restriction-modification methylase/restriction endonuclease TaqI-like protein